jgi:hypothetical protein
MNEDTIQKRIADFTMRMHEAQKLTHLYEGAIQDCEWFLAELRKPAVPAQGEIHLVPFHAPPADEGEA